MKDIYEQLEDLQTAMERVVDGLEDGPWQVDVESSVLLESIQARAEAVKRAAKEKLNRTTKKQFSFFYEDERTAYFGVVWADDKRDANLKASEVTGSDWNEISEVNLADDITLIGKEIKGGKKD